MSFIMPPQPVHISREEMVAESLLDGYQPDKGESVGQNAPVKHRHGEALAVAYGYLTLGHLIDDIPADADVMDVGAGASTLGMEVCEDRPDVRWLNIDTAYSDPYIMQRLTARAPSNLSFLAADAASLNEAIGDRRFDRGFSWWLVGHMALDGRDVAVNGSRSMLQALKPDRGRLDAGPVFRRTYLPRGDNYARSVSIRTPNRLEELDQTAEEMARVMAPKGIFKWLQRHGNGIAAVSSEA